MVEKWPDGKGMMIWRLSRCAGADPNALAARAVEAKFRWVAIKTVEGTYAYQLTYLAPAIRALHEAGVRVLGWGYAYGYKPKSEALTAAAAIKEYGLSGWLIDAEVEYKGKPAEASAYAATLRGQLPEVPIGLCSYRFPTYHGTFPFKQFLEVCDFHAPQVYWIGARNPGAQLIRSLKELRSIKCLPVVPIGAVFSESGWSPTVAELDQFDKTASDQSLPGVGWWSWQHAEAVPEWWGAIAKHRSTVPPSVVTPTLEERLAHIDASIEHIEQFLKTSGFVPL